MTALEMNDVRELTIDEVEEVNGGIWPLVVLLLLAGCETTRPRKEEPVLGPN